MFGCHNHIRNQQSAEPLKSLLIFMHVSSSSKRDSVQAREIATARSSFVSLEVNSLLPINMSRLLCVDILSMFWRIKSSIRVAFNERNKRDSNG